MKSRPPPIWPRGTKITLELKDDAKDFAKESTVEHIIPALFQFRPLSDRAEHQAPQYRAGDLGAQQERDQGGGIQRVLHLRWPRSRQALFRLHFSADAPLAIQALLFVPSRNFETLGMGRIDSEVNLYCRKVLIQAKAKGLFPDWLRFLKGVVDSEDLPLNISRETMQDTTLMQKLNKVLTSRFLKFLDEQSEKEATPTRSFITSINVS